MAAGRATAPIRARTPGIDPGRARSDTVAGPGGRAPRVGRKGRMPNVEELQIANKDLLTLLLQFNAVSELMNRASIPLDKARVLESIAIGVRSELAFDRVAVWRYDAPSQSFLGEAAMGLPVDLVRSLRFPLNACLPLVRQALNEGRTLRQDPALLAPLLEA